MRFKLLFPTVVVFIFGLLIVFSRHANSANLIQVKDTLQYSRISFNGRVDATVGIGTTNGASRVLIKTAASAPANSISTAGLKPNDVLTIGTGSYTILGITNTSSFTVTPVLAVGDADDNDVIYFKSKPQHVVSFITASAVANGYFQILLPADTTTPNDGAPDDQGFDFNTTVTVVGTNTTGYTFSTGTATASAGTNCVSPANYHCFEARYTGVGAIGASITIAIGTTSGSTNPIAPAPIPSTHAEGTADTYTVLVRNITTSNIITDSTNGKIGVIESVRVTATVDPTITFSIASLGVGASTCGVPNTITTTATSVPFGTLGLNAFATGAQLLTVSTNAVNGYSVTAIENGALSIGGLGVTTIVDTPCDSGPCTSTIGVGWTGPTNNGFGYSLSLGTGATAPFVAGANFTSRKFDTTTPREIMSSTGISDAHTLNVCYRVSVGATQAAGDYENLITYTATATF